MAKAIIEFVKQSGVEVLVLGATAKGSIFRYDVLSAIPMVINDNKSNSIILIFENRVSLQR